MQRLQFLKVSVFIFISISTHHHPYFKKLNITTTSIYSPPPVWFRTTQTPLPLPTSFCEFNSLFRRFFFISPFRSYPPSSLSQLSLPIRNVIRVKAIKAKQSDADGGRQCPARVELLAEHLQHRQRLDELQWVQPWRDEQHRRVG